MRLHINSNLHNEFRGTFRITAAGSLFISCPGFFFSETGGLLGKHEQTLSKGRRSAELERVCVCVCLSVQAGLVCADVWFIQVRFWRPSVQVYVFMRASVHGWSRVALSDKGHAGVRAVACA